MSNEVPETQTIQLNADGPLDSEMTPLLRAAIRRARKGGVTRLLDGEQAVAEIVAPRKVTVDLSEIPLGTEEVLTREEVYGKADFRGALETLINRHARENRSNTPDFILAGFLETCLKAFELATHYRDDWYSVHLAPADKYFTDNAEDVQAFPTRHPTAYSYEAAPEPDALPECTGANDGTCPKHPDVTTPSLVHLVAEPEPPSEGET